MVRRLTSRKRFGLVSLLSLSLLAGSAAAQSPTGTVSGRVVDEDGRPVPGVIVSLESASMPGTQRTETSRNGDYAFSLLPPGQYELSFERSSFAPIRQARQVAAGEPVALDVTLSPAAVTETVNVTASSGPFAGTVESSTNLQHDLIAALPTNRSIASVVALAPGVHQTGPDGAVSIAGAMSYDNVFQLNGVQIQDNLRGTPLNLFIEDAIHQTTVSTAGISAEYGRFTGGVVNAITKSGGNVLSGSIRTSFSNDNWRSVSPFDEPKTDRTVPTYEYTMGGYVLRDRLWFFGAGRTSDRTVSRQTGYTDIPYQFRDDEQRVEVKLTQAIQPTQRVSVAYTGIRETQYNSAYPNPANVMDLASLTTRTVPQNLLAVHYTGTFGSNFFVEGQYSSRTFAFEGDGGLFTDPVRGTPLRDQTTGAYWWSPNFCGVCASEQRDNTDLVLKGTYFLSSGLGSHLMTFGYDSFNDKTLVDNHQSASDYHVWTTASLVDGGMVYPIVEPGFSTYIIWWPLAESSQGTNFRTHSLFVNDRWSLNDRWSFNLGLRYDQNAGKDASGQTVADDSAFSPRVGVAYDVTGTGQTTVTASAGRYVSALANNVASQGSAAGLPSIYGYFYDGPGINLGGGPLVPSDTALTQIFDWFNQANPDPFFVDIPGVATRIEGSLKSPHADEMAVGVTQRLGQRGVVRADFVNRQFADFYANRIDTMTGLVFDEFGQPYDLKLIENTNELTREYRALDLQGSYRFGSVYVGGSYTLSDLSGNVNGENSGSGPVAAGILSYPEYFDRAWRYPTGNLSADQRHRGRLWGTYVLPETRVGNMSVGVIQHVQSGTPYGAAGAVLVAPFVDNPGYALPPDTMSYFFTPRDAFRTETMYRTDVSFNLSKSLSRAGQSEVFAQFQLFNLFDQFQLFDASGGAINTTVLTAIDDPNRFDFFDPFTDTPVQGVHWDYGDRFGEAVSHDAFTTPRTFRFSVGFRF